MNNIIKYTALTSTALLCGFMLVQNKVLADDTSTDGASMKSIGTITYEVDTSTVDPLDPDKPDITNPVVPGDSGDHENPTPGPLSIDYISNIRFEKQKTTGNDTTYYASLDHLKDSTGASIDRPNYLQVTDKRGSNAGWHLTVNESQFTNGQDELTGAELTLDHAVLVTPDDGTTPTASQAIKLTPGTTTDVVDAKADQGTGTWITKFGKDEDEGKTSISLSVPGKTKKVQGEYKSSLTWTLTDSPA